MIVKTHVILYVADQARSTAFYSAVLDLAPTLNAPGMTEFELAGQTILGLMPESGIRKLIGQHLPDPALARGTPRAELYLLVDSPEAYHRRAMAAGAGELSGLALRNWGHWVSYCLDPDTHVIAFATTTK